MHPGLDLEKKKKQGQEEEAKGGEDEEEEKEGEDPHLSPTALTNPLSSTIRVRFCRPRKIIVVKILNF